MGTKVRAQDGPACVADQVVMRRVYVFHTHLTTRENEVGYGDPE